MKKITKKCFSTVVSDLWGRDNYQEHIVVGREFWWCYPSAHDIAILARRNWVKIKVTYIRSGCMFYICPDFPYIDEQFCAIDSVFASTLILAEIDPIKDLGDKLGDIEAAKLKYCFNTDHTVVHNWPNEREIEIDENKYYSKISPIDYIELLYLEQKKESN